MKSETLKIARSLDLPFPLRDYQWEGVNFLISNTQCLLADDMGLGKTVQVAVALEILYRQGAIFRVLIVVPSSLKLNWESELKKWAPSLSVQRMTGGGRNRWAYFHLPYNVMIASYEDVRIQYSSSNIRKKYDLVVIDEAQRIKNANSSTSAMCKRIKKTNAWALSGTPIENRREDLISIFQFLRFDILNENMSKEEIHTTMSDMFLRREKAEVLKELPKIVEQVIPLEFGIMQSNAYQNVLQQQANSIRGNMPTANLFAIIQKLKNVCNYDETTGTSIKWDALKLSIYKVRENKNKILIFSQYVKTLEWLKTKIESMDVRTFLYTGGNSESEKDIILNEFKNITGPTVLLMSLKAGGVGLNIQEADTVVMYDRWWNPAAENQAINRAHRFGREKPLNVIKYIVANTIEEHIDNILTEKEKLFEEYIQNAESYENAAFKTETIKYLMKNINRNTGD
jgi:SNF2 family DNA or RNA helicase